MDAGWKANHLPFAKSGDTCIRNILETVGWKRFRGKIEPESAEPPSIPTFLVAGWQCGGFHRPRRHLAADAHGRPQATALLSIEVHREQSHILARWPLAGVCFG